MALGLAVLALGGCAGAGAGSATGLSGGAVSCPEGPRQSLDCRGVLQQFARDLKADLSALQIDPLRVQAGVAVNTVKLIEADALSGDIIQHHYQTCSLYNACVISRQEFAAKMDKLHQLQLEVRKALGAGGITAVAAQQNIQINPIAAPPPLLESQPQGAPPPAFPPPPTDPSGAPAGSLPPPLPPPPAATVIPPTPVLLPPPGTPGSSQPAFPAPGALPSSTVSLPPGADSPQARIDAVLGVLREGSRLIRGPQAPAPAQPVPSGAAAAPGGAPPADLDAVLRGMLVSLKQDAVGQRPALASGRAVVGNFSEEGQPFAGALGAVLQERVDAIVRSDAMFAPPARQTRGITVKEVAAVQNPNDPKSAAAVYGGDLAIGGTYRVQGEQVVVRLSAMDAGGAPLAQATQAIPTQSLPASLQAAPANAADTGQLLSALERLGPKAQASARVEVTTNQPGTGATFRLGEEIRYLVTSTMAGHLYLFHVDAEKSVTRIFPNDYQREARVQAGAALEVPASGAPFKFEASPPFGLETTVALVTAAPLGEADLQMIATTLAQPSQQGMAATRGIAVKASGPAGAGGTPPSAGAAGSPGLVWNSVTVLVRP